MIYLIKFNIFRKFPGGLAARIQRFHSHGSDSILHGGTEIPQAAQHNQKKKKIQHLYFLNTYQLLILKYSLK